MSVRVGGHVGPVYVGTRVRPVHATFSLIQAVVVLFALTVGMLVVAGIAAAVALWLLVNLLIAIANGLEREFGHGSKHFNYVRWPTSHRVNRAAPIRRAAQIEHAGAGVRHGSVL